MASASRIVPAPISEEMTKEIQDLAVKTFKVLGSSGVCRIDFMINGATNQVYVNEINTIPGSLAFYLWKEAGMNFTELMEALAKQAINRQRRREKRITSFDSNILSNFSASSAKGVKGVKGVK
jgi:D-alanine-D-alanine ligase